jgi:hypothetical protein
MPSESPHENAKSVRGGGEPTPTWRVVFALCSFIVIVGFGIYAKERYLDPITRLEMRIDWLESELLASASTEDEYLDIFPEQRPIVFRDPFRSLSELREERIPRLSQQPKPRSPNLESLYGARIELSALSKRWERDRGTLALIAWSTSLAAFALAVPEVPGYLVRVCGIGYRAFSLHFGGWLRRNWKPD